MNEFQKRSVFVNILKKYYSYMYNAESCDWKWNNGSYFNHTFVFGWQLLLVDFRTDLCVDNFQQQLDLALKGASVAHLAQCLHRCFTIQSTQCDGYSRRFERNMIKMYLSWSYSVITDHIQFTQCMGYCTTAHCIRYSPLFSRHNVRGPLIETVPGTITFSCHS